MKVVKVRTAKEYSVLIEDGLLDYVGSYARVEVGGLHACIITDAHIVPLYLDRVVRSLEKAGYQVSSKVLPAGEQHKTIESFAQCLTFMSEQNLSRDDVVVALGGGVVGDIAGFCAATYMRGCHCLQIPLSLLAMVDSSVGGKTAVNLPTGKNLVGAFYQPDLVCIDPRVLQSLDPYYFVDGCAEIIKYSLLQGDKLYQELLNPLKSLDKRLEVIIEICVAMKRGIVESDEKEKHNRQLLNLGHTFGHAFETLSDYSLSHGRGVACGMMCAAQIAHHKFKADPKIVDDVSRILSVYNLPQTMSCCLGFVPTVDQLYESLLSDKKIHATSVNLVIPYACGDVRIEPVELDELKECVQIALDCQ